MIWFFLAPWKIGLQPRFSCFRSPRSLSDKEQIEKDSLFIACKTFWLSDALSRGGERKISLSFLYLRSETRGQFAADVTRMNDDE